MDGHDIDLLISPLETDRAVEKGLLKRLVSDLVAEGNRTSHCISRDRQADVRPPPPPLAGAVLHGSYEADSFRQDVLQVDMSRGTELRSQLDHFEKWLGIVKFPSDLSSEEEEEEAPEPPAAKRRREDAEFRVNFAIADDLTTLRALAADPERRWVARRVDLVVVPPQQLAYALVGWTGNRHFNRDLRLYAQRELGLKLSSHGLFDPKTVRRRSGI